MSEIIIFKNIRWFRLDDFVDQMAGRSFMAYLSSSFSGAKPTLKLILHTPDSLPVLEIWDNNALKKPNVVGRVTSIQFIQSNWKNTALIYLGLFLPFLLFTVFIFPWFVVPAVFAVLLLQLYLRLLRRTDAPWILADLESPDGGNYAILFKAPHDAPWAAGTKKLYEAIIKQIYSGFVEQREPITLRRLILDRYPEKWFPIMIRF